MARPDSGKCLSEPGPPENLLVVEGKSDFYVFKGLFLAHGLNGKCRLTEEEGYEQLRGTIDTHLLESGLANIGFVVDGDTDVQARWDSLRDVLLSPRCGYEADRVEAAPNPNGVIVEQPGKPRVGLWLMPNNARTGALEDFLGDLVPANDTLWPYAAACVAGLPTLLPNATENWKSKARMYTWLAWQDEPGDPLGLAVRFRLNPHAEAARPFLGWLRDLFQLPAPVS